jgi:hypothetical protein
MARFGWAARQARQGKDSFELVAIPRIKAWRRHVAAGPGLGMGGARQGKVKAAEETQSPFFVATP